VVLKLDLGGCFPEAGPSREDFLAAMPRARAAREAHLSHPPDWRGLGGRTDLLEACRQRAAVILEQEPETFVILGIGGSALGNSALLGALAPFSQEWAPADGRPRVVVLDTVDPDWLKGFLDSVEVDRCHFNVISKSGGTLETAAQFLLFHDAVEKALGSREEARSRFTMTTDPEGGHLRALAEEQGFATLPIPSEVGGRFSVLTPVGLLMAEVAGLDAGSLLEGAAKTADSLRECPPEEDAALAWALAHVLHLEAGRPLHVHFPYGHRLRLLADWFLQLWAESLGKKEDADGKVVHVGPTPVRAVGPTDQHSQCQLYVEGPDDKVFTFVRVEKPDWDGSLPSSFADIPAFEALRGQDLGDLMEAERRGTEAVLREAGRPCAVLELCKLDAFHVGQYFMFFEIATAYAGGLMGVNPYDQPGVEAGKLAALALMGAKGHEGRAEEISSLLGGEESLRFSC
jgi:glucose-6-phosphate isomerase